MVLKHLLDRKSWGMILLALVFAFVVFVFYRTRFKGPADLNPKQVDQMTERTE